LGRKWVTNIKNIDGMERLQKRPATVEKELTKVTLQFSDELPLVQFMYNRRFPWYHRNNEKHELTCELDPGAISTAEELYQANVIYH
jgi:hypothetical protein